MKPNLLFITHQLPARTGSGTPMRLGMNLEALSEIYRVYLLIVPFSQATGLDEAPDGWFQWVFRAASLRIAGREDPAFRGIENSADAVRLLEAERSTHRTLLTRYSTPEVIRDAGRLFADVRFDAVHVCRLHMAPFAEPYLRPSTGHRPRALLDLDDHESRTRARIAALATEAGDKPRAAAESLTSEKYESLERTWLPFFDEIWVCSHVDRAEIERLYQHSGVKVVPNAVRFPPESPPQQPGKTFRLLFVGNMHYLPNEDAALRLVRDVLPGLSSRGPRPVRLVVAGKHRTAAIEELAQHPQVTMLGWVPELAPCYRDADVMVVPLRAGGGTRIKILEAFSYRRPVIASRIGAEGLEVTHQREILLADSPSEITAACLWLIENPARARALAERAYRWVRAHHGPAQVRDAIMTAPRSSLDRVPSPAPTDR